MLKKIIKRIIPNEWRYRIVNWKYVNNPEPIIKEWEKNGCQIPPPPVVKQKVIREYQEKYNCKTLVETGTYLGYMVAAQKNNFENIYSVEISEKLYLRAKKLFRKYPHIKLLLGDSGKVMPQIMEQINGKALFWLDGHYSAGITSKGELNCPIWKELDAIFENRNDHILLIDDARDFNGTNDYPTIDELERYLHKKNENYKMSVENDIVRVVL
ncbi:MAG: hypothetical protein JXR61_08950 [Prolixibacteraceae bacterium]|nr:hypothetical protein [Prolixibacteraceae bacterium]